MSCLECCSGEGNREVLSLQENCKRSLKTACIVISKIAICILLGTLSHMLFPPVGLALYMLPIGFTAGLLITKSIFLCKPGIKIPCRHFFAVENKVFRDIQLVMLMFAMVLSPFFPIAGVVIAAAVGTIHGIVYIASPNQRKIFVEVNP